VFQPGVHLTSLAWLDSRVFGVWPNWSARLLTKIVIPALVRQSLLACALHCLIKAALVLDGRGVSFSQINECCF